MLSNEQKEKLRKIHIYEISDTERNGIAIKTNVSKVKEDFIIPTVYDIAESIFKQILEAGFSIIERVSPSDANCIVRVFQKTHHKYDFDIVFNFYGADCFVKDNKTWTSESECSNRCFPLDYSKYLVGQWIASDEEVFFDTDFVDFYIKVH